MIMMIILYYSQHATPGHCRLSLSATPPKNNKLQLPTDKVLIAIKVLYLKILNFCPTLDYCHSTIAPAVQHITEDGLFVPPGAINSEFNCTLLPTFLMFFFHQLELEPYPTDLCIFNFFSRLHLYHDCAKPEITKSNSKLKNHLFDKRQIKRKSVHNR